MQSQLRDLPAIQAGMLVASAVTFQNTGSEVRWRLAAANLCLRWELRIQSFCYLQGKWMRPITATGT